MPPKSHSLREARHYRANPAFRWGEPSGPATPDAIHVPGSGSQLEFVEKGGASGNKGERVARGGNAGGLKRQNHQKPSEPHRDRLVRLARWTSISARSLRQKFVGMRARDAGSLAPVHGLIATDSGNDGPPARKSRFRWV
jgi:hypothetical protein